VCEGYSHALAGAVAGAAASLYVLHLPLPQTAALTALSAGAGILPDLDHPSATLAHTFGFLTKAVAEIVGKVSGGHRHGTHSIVGAAFFTALAALAVAFRPDIAGRIGLCVLLSLILAGGFCALHLARVFRRVCKAAGVSVSTRAMNHAADGAAILASVVMASTGAGLGLVATATGLGCAAHLAADGLTTEGIPVAWPLWNKHVGLPHPLSFTTGTWRERYLVAPALMLALVFLALVALHVPLPHLVHGRLALP